MGPLTGLSVLEIAGMGPGPFCAMVLADMGADVLRLDRASTVPPDGADFEPSVDHILNRGRRSVAVDLKHPEGAAVVLQLVQQADVLIEGFRPGVAERLGIGPEPCLERNPALVYGRMTGWGQAGPYAAEPGHDLNYIAVSGMLSLIGRRGGPPTPPLNLVGDFGGGGMLLACGVLAALWERGRSGAGQVVDAAMADGAALLGTLLYGMRQAGAWSGERGGNLLDGGAPFYDVYETADGGHVSVAAIEPQFYAALLRGLELDADDLPDQLDSERWPEVKARFATAFRTRTRAEWCDRFEGTGACFAPVLTVDEAPGHEINAARGVFTELAGVTQPAPAPRFSRTPGAIVRPAPTPGEHTAAALADWGLAADEIEGLAARGVVAARGGARSPAP